MSYSYKLVNIRHKNLVKKKIGLSIILVLLIKLNVKYIPSSDSAHAIVLSKKTNLNNKKNIYVISYLG